MLLDNNYFFLYSLYLQWVEILCVTQQANEAANAVNLQWVEILCVTQHTAHTDAESDLQWVEILCVTQHVPQTFYIHIYNE